MDLHYDENQSRFYSLDTRERVFFLSDKKEIPVTQVKFYLLRTTIFPIIIYIPERNRRTTVIRDERKRRDLGPRGVRPNSIPAFRATPEKVAGTSISFLW